MFNRCRPSFLPYRFCWVACDPNPVNRDGLPTFAVVQIVVRFAHQLVSAAGARKGVKRDALRTLQKIEDDMGIG
jgi:hypothetical protein